MKSSEIRQKFLDFFAAQQHTIVSSSSLIPGNDPTLMFTNSGMVQFKDTFLGKEKRPYVRATTAQRCVRAGGKHNDLENVGYTARHHTFFEMLGNFSFGDYFKQNAIHYAWELLTTVYQLPKEKLWVTVYHEDDEAYNIWLNEIKVPAERIIRIGDNKGGRYASDNFWQMGDTGPCGPCSEIFYDHGPDVWGGPPGSPEEDGDRYIEIWNLVFMQFERDEQGVMHPLPKPCVDTGMGLERISAVLQNVHSNYEIDLFQNLIQSAAQATNTKDIHHNSLKVIADHIRACSFLVIDGVIPSNEGRGYVLRRIIRRALRHGYKLGQKQPFFHTLVDSLCREMGVAYPELVAQKERVAAVLKQEEERFGETLENGMKILEQALQQLGDKKVLDGKTVFTLYDTFGFPFDLTADICREHQLEVDEAGFNVCMEQQRTQARAAGKFKAQTDLGYTGAQTQFKGYEVLETEAKVLAIYVDGAAVDTLAAGQSAIIVLDNTPFYAESGGQVGDSGLLSWSNTVQFVVEDTQKIQPNVFGHHGVLQQGSLKVGDSLQAAVDTQRRTHIIRNHSATHLLHKALKKVLGDHVQQKGSHVDENRTRFDFIHDSAVTLEQIQQVEQLVLQEILANQPVQTEHMHYDAALQSGATALFGEKYADEVRVLTIGFSKELCGGTHVQRTGEIGLCKITLETAVASGVRRLEAVTGHGALAMMQKTFAEQSQLAGMLKTAPTELFHKTQALLEQVRLQEKEMQGLRAKIAASASGALAQQAQGLANGAQLLVKELSGVSSKDLRTVLESVKEKLSNGIIVLATIEDGKVSLVAGVTATYTAQVKANELINFLAQQVGGKGGGKADFAMAGGTETQKLSSALASVPAWVEGKFA